MNPFNNPDPEHIQPGERIVTACGGITKFSPEIEHAFYKGKVVYFCLPACKLDFERDPGSSCLAASISQYE